MKHRHTLILLSVALPICVLLRAMQMYFTIDGVTGFVKQQYSAISVIITVIICAASAAIGLLAATIDEVKQNANKQRPAVAIAGVLAGGMFIYQAVAGFSVVGSGAWYDALLVLLSFVSAFVFVAYGLKNIYDYNLPSILLISPVLYYIVKLISVFVSTAKLALVTENIFLIFTSGVLLWFMLEFASFENGIGDVDKRPKKLFAAGLAAVMLCGVTAIPKLAFAVLNIMQLQADDIASALINVAIGVFILVYILCNFGDKRESKKAVGKHSA